MNITDTTDNSTHKGGHADYAGAKMGMWLFLFTELLFFGGLFLLYAVYRSQFPGEFHATSAELNTAIGAANTVVLITSSLTMALSITAMKKGDRNLTLLFQVCTIVLAFTFLGVKYVEWTAKISHGLYPGADVLAGHAQGAILFYSLYYVMTGIHAIHVMAGIVVLMIMLVLSYRRRITASNFIKLENSGLYWHFVDVIWVYLFPLLYLIG